MISSPIPNRAFDEISENNSNVDEILDGFVETALDRVKLDRDAAHGPEAKSEGAKVADLNEDEREIRKTTRLLFLFGFFGQ